MSLNLLIIILVSFLVYYSLRLYKRYLLRKFQIKLYVLRDVLRELAIDKDVNKHDFLFKFLDNSISKSVNSIQQLNLWYIVYLFHIHKSDKSLQHFKLILKDSLKRNPKLNDVFQSYNELIASYVMQKHIVLFFCLHLGFTSMITSISFFRKLKVRVSGSIKSLSSMPEISASDLYLAPC